MSSTQRRVGRHLAAASRRAIESCPAYPPPETYLNPLTRALARDIAGKAWASKAAQIDFPYTAEKIELAGVRCVRYRTNKSRAENPLILYVHAGAFVCGSANDFAAAIAPACETSACEAIAIDYSLAPESPYPTQLEEIEKVYCALMADGRAPERIVLMGDSAGATLILVSINRWKRAGLPAPAGAILMSILADCLAESDTYITLGPHDPCFGELAAVGASAMAALYAPGVDPGHPQISPLNDAYQNPPPLLIQVGAREVLLGDSTRLAEKARRAGGDVTLCVFDGMYHLFHMDWSTPEARAAYANISSFIARVAPA